MMTQSLTIMNWPCCIVKQYTLSVITNLLCNMYGLNRGNAASMLILHLSLTAPFSFLCSEMQGIKLGPLGYAPDLEHQATNSIFTDNAFDCLWV